MPIATSSIPADHTLKLDYVAQIPPRAIHWCRLYPTLIVGNLAGELSLELKYICLNLPRATMKSRPLANLSYVIYNESLCNCLGDGSNECDAGLTGKERSQLISYE